MALAQTAPRLSEAEYLAIERAAEFKSEFFDGEMFAMAGGTFEHAVIGTNLLAELSNQLRGRPCVAANSDLRIKVEETGLLTYPDASVICGEPEFVAETDDTVLNSTVIFEVLSDSTEAYDRGRKFENYQRIPTLREYLLVSQHEPRIEQFIRQENDDWLLRAASGLNAAIELASGGIQVRLAEVFLNVRFGRLRLRTVTPRKTL
jgi:Uma2 family endonuclease